MMAAILCILSALLLSAQGLENEVGSLSQLKDQHDDLMSEVKSFLLEFAKSAQDTVQESVEQLQATLDEATDLGLQSIHEKYDLGRDQLRMINAPKVCLDNADQELLAAKDLHKGSFLSCANLTQAGLDVVQIVMEAGNLGIDALLTLDDVLNGFGKCLSFNPIRFFSCTFSWIKTTIKDTFRSFKDLSQFTSKVASLVQDIKEQITFCSNRGHSTAIVDTVRSLQGIHECADRHRAAAH